MSLQEMNINKEKLLAYKEAKRQGKLQDFDSKVKVYGIWLERSLFIPDYIYP